MKTHLAAQDHADLAREGISVERYAVMMAEAVKDMVDALQRCSVFDPELIDEHFCPDGTMSGPEWLALHGFPEKMQEGGE